MFSSLAFNVNCSTLHCTCTVFIQCMFTGTVLHMIYLSIQVPLPEGVTARYAHSLSAVITRPNCVWLVVVGGFVKIEERGGVKKWFDAYLTDQNVITVVIELGK